jgi:hypothetical protein
VLFCFSVKTLKRKESHHKAAISRHCGDFLIFIGDVNAAKRFFRGLIRQMQQSRGRLSEKNMPYPWGSAPHTRTRFLKKRGTSRRMGGYIELFGELCLGETCTLAHFLNHF